MNILIDMNLSPLWCEYLHNNGFNAVNWSEIGDPSATDLEIFNHARNNGHVIFTHDLDFGVILANTNETGPSILQIRTLDTMPSVIGPTIISIIIKYKNELKRTRVRILPLWR